MKLGIVGLPNVGKSTLFNAITKSGAEAANYPFCTIEPNVGVVTVPDERLDVLAKMYSSKKILPAVIEFVDIAGLVKGASKGEGLGNKFLSHIREVDAIVHVVRCFDGGDIIHVNGKTNPISDIETIRLELIFSDIEMVDKRLERCGKGLKSGSKSVKAEYELLCKIKKGLESGSDARLLDFSEEEAAVLSLLPLITLKPVIFAANVAEDEVSDYSDNPYVADVERLAQSQNCGMVVVSAKIEEEIASVPDDDRLELMEALGIEKSGLDRLISESYSLLGLISYLTAGPQEVRAWTITKGTKAPEAAGKIHSDFERGFIRAEVVSYDDLQTAGSMNSAREKGLVRSEGKSYVVRDGDVILFRFNV